MCCSIEELFEFKDKTDYRYSEAIIDECTGKEGKYSKLYKAAESLAITKNISVVEAMAELSIAILLINANSRCVEPPFAIIRTYCF